MKIEKGLQNCQVLHNCGSGFIFFLRNFGQMFKFERNFSVISEFIWVIFIIASMIFCLETKILLSFAVILTEFDNLF